MTRKSLPAWHHNLMSHDRCKRGLEHLTNGQQRITYKKRLILTLCLTQSNQWVYHTVRIYSMNSPPMISNVDKKNENNDDDINDKIKMMYDLHEHEQCEYEM